MKGSIYTRISTAHPANSVLPTHTKFTTKQKAKIGKCLELVNDYLFECYNEPKKVYKLNDIYRVLSIMLQDGTASDIDEAIDKFMEKLK